MSNSALNYPEAYVSSLPLSLRHPSPEAALEEAQWLVDFLRDVTLSKAGDESCSSKESALGLSLVLDLVQDKLNVASGVYRFPLLAWNEDAPVLAERKGADDE